MRAWHRGVDVEPLGPVGTAPSTVFHLHFEQEIDTPLERYLNLGFGRGRDRRGFRALNCQRVNGRRAVGGFLAARIARQTHQRQQREQCARDCDFGEGVHALHRIVGNALCGVPGVRYTAERHGGRSLQLKKECLVFVVVLLFFLDDFVALFEAF